MEKVTTGSNTYPDFAKTIAIQDDGKIVVAGSSFNGSNYDFGVIRYNTDGSLDKTFDGDGIVTTAFGIGTDEAKSVVIQSDGKMVVGGYSVTNTKSNFALARYNITGVWIIPLEVMVS